MKIHSFDHSSPSYAAVGQAIDLDKTLHGTDKQAEALGKSATQSDKQTKQQAEAKEAKEAVLSQKWDEVAQGYKKGNPAFKEQYEHYEDALRFVRAQISELQKQITKLKTSPVQRMLRIEQDAPDLGASAREESTLDQKQHPGAREYQSNAEQTHIDALEQQLGDLKGHEADLKRAMFAMIKEEADRLKRKNRR